MLNNGGFGEEHRFPFTALQWEELEQQALIFKYLISGIPVPPHLLLFSFKQSQQSNNNREWSFGCLQTGSGRRFDPEPGRCRRTDGKKWRCSKEAFPDSKYCDKHMHRGKNRSRKPNLQQKSMEFLRSFPSSLKQPLAMEFLPTNQEHYNYRSAIYTEEENERLLQLGPLNEKGGEEDEQGRTYSFMEESCEWKKIKKLENSWCSSSSSSSSSSSTCITQLSISIPARSIV